MGLEGESLAVWLLFLVTLGGLQDFKRERILNERGKERKSLPAG